MTLVASLEHSCIKASSIGLHSIKSEQSRQAISMMLFAAFITGEFAGQTETIPMLLDQVQKGPHDFCSFYFRTWFAVEPMHGLARMA